MTDETLLVKRIAALSPERLQAVQQLDPRAMEVWDTELASAAESVHADRAAVFEAGRAALEAATAAILDRTVELEYRPGWDTDRGLDEVLRERLARDQQRGGTFDRLGPGDCDVQIVDARAEAQQAAGPPVLHTLVAVHVVVAIATKQPDPGQTDDADTFVE